MFCLYWCNKEVNQKCFLLLVEKKVRNISYFLVWMHAYGLNETCMQLVIYEPDEYIKKMERG